MPKTKISEYSATANSNTDVASINIDEGCAPSGINNAIRAVMGHLKDFQQGTNGDPFNGPVNGTLGATTASTANVTTLTTSSTVTHNGGTANGVAYLNGSKVLTTGSALTFDGTNFATTGAGTFSGLLSRIHAQGTDAYITNTTTGKANTVMGFNDSGSTTAQGIPTGYAYYGTLQSYPVGFTSGGYLTNSISSTAHIWNTTGSEQMRLTSTGLKTKTTISVGDATPSTSGAGITFPATQSASSDANTLDDYEEGTFTPAMSSGSGGPIVLSTATGKYTKIGNVVTFALRLIVSNANSAGGAISITNLPFTSTSYANRNRVVSGDIENVTGSTMDNLGGTFVASSSTQINILSSIFANIVLTNTSSMDFNGTYFAA